MARRVRGVGGGGGCGGVGHHVGVDDLGDQGGGRGHGGGGRSRAEGGEAEGRRRHGAGQRRRRPHHRPLVVAVLDVLDVLQRGRAVAQVQLQLPAPDFSIDD